MHVSSHIAHEHCLILSACRRRITRILNLACNDLALLDWLLEVRFFSLSHLNVHDSLSGVYNQETTQFFCQISVLVGLLTESLNQYHYLYHKGNDSRVI